MSEDEKVTRDILLKEPKKLSDPGHGYQKHSQGSPHLPSTLEMGLPFLILLNMWDEAKSRGIEIKIQVLSEILGAPS